LVDAELKSLLTLLIDKVEVIGQEVAGTKGEVIEIKAILPTLATKEEVAGIKEEVAGIKAILPTLATKEEVAEIKAILPTLATKDDIAVLQREHSLTRQVVGSNHHNLTGRVDQLTLQYETLVGARTSAAE